MCQNKSVGFDSTSWNAIFMNKLLFITNNLPVQKHWKNGPQGGLNGGNYGIWAMEFYPLF